VREAKTPPSLRRASTLLAAGLLASCGSTAPMPSTPSPSPSPGATQSAPRPPSAVEGYGAGATGGAGGSVCTVTTSAESGAGSLASCLDRGGNQTVQFAVTSTTLAATAYLSSNLTIDGCANGQNGVTILQPADRHRALVVEGPASNFVFRCLRFQGTGKVAPNFLNEHDLLALDGTESPVSRVLVDQCTFVGASDGATDIVGDVTDVTVERSLYYDSALTMLIKYGTRQRLSLHHNVFTHGTERNPQIRGDARDIVFVSNVVHDSVPRVDPENGSSYSPYGSLFYNSGDPGEGIGDVFVIARSNAWLGENTQLEIVTDPGRSAAGIFLADNLCNPGPCPGSPAGAPTFTVPAAAAVTVTPIEGLKAMLATVGSPSRTALDQTRLDAVAAALP
jgi:hypothetical protein